jgi:hypothetical protein
MKTYHEVVERYARIMFGKYMSGSNDYYCEDVNTVAFMFDKTSEEVSADVESRFEALCKEHYDRLNAV